MSPFARRRTAPAPTENTPTATGWTV